MKMVPPHHRSACVLSLTLLCSCQPESPRSGGLPAPDSAGASLAAFSTDVSASIHNPREGRFIGEDGSILLLDRHPPFLRLIARDGELVWSGDPPPGSPAPGEPEAIGVAGERVLLLERGRVVLYESTADSLAVAGFLPLPARYLPMGAVRGCSGEWLVYARDDEPQSPAATGAPDRIRVTSHTLRTAAGSLERLSLWVLPLDPMGGNWEGHSGSTIAARDSVITLLHRASPKQAGVVIEASCDGAVLRRYREESLVTGDSVPVVLPRPRALEWMAGIAALPGGFIAAQQRWFSPAVHQVDSYRYATELLRFTGGEYAGSLVVRGQWKVLDYRAGAGLLLAATEPAPHVAVLPDSSLETMRAAQTMQSGGIAARRVATIGAADGGGADVFGRVRDVAISTEGRLFVLDSYANHVAIFDTSGTLVRVVGRQGRGPGEFLDPRGLRWRSDSALWVMDYGTNRYTELSQEGAVTATYARQVVPWGVDWLGSFDSAGRLYDTSVVPDREGRTTRQVLVRHHLTDGAVVPVDTFALPPLQETSYVVTFAGGLLNVPVPYTPRPSWVFDGQNSLWSGTGSSSVIARHGLRGDTTLELQLDRPRKRVMDPDRAAAIAATRSLLEEAGADPRNLDWERVPRYAPVHGRLYLDGSGRLWVAHFSATPQCASTYDVFTPAGQFAGQVTLQVTQGRPLSFRGPFVAGVCSDGEGVDTVIIYRLLS